MSNNIPSDERAGEILTNQFGGRLISIVRQARWRPTWFAEVERDGVVERVVLRGDRTDSESFPLRHEYAFHRLLEERDFPVPNLYGYIETPGMIDTFVTSFVPGVPHFEGVDDADRDVIVDEYVQQLARLHQLDAKPFIEAGLVHPEPDENTGMVGHRFMEGRYRERKAHSDPFAEFCLGWHHRHLPDGRGRTAPCIWDTGQFHHQDGHMVAILDLEFGHVGDPMGDITIWRMRDTLIPFGDMRKIYARYEELTGEPVDLEAVKRHHFAACMGNQLQFGAAVANPSPATDLMNFMQWNSETNLMATDFLGEYLGIELPEVEPPAPRTSSHDVTFDQLIRALGNVSPEDPDLQHDLRLAFRMARHLKRRSQIGDELDAADIEDVHALTGRKPIDWQEAEQELEQFVMTDAEVGRHDEALTILFHKRHLRRHMALGPAGSSMTRHYECQRFDGKTSRIIQL
jgi:aminoglycoside phosphotransferase (APT) family kinase protein